MDRGLSISKHRGCQRRQTTAIFSPRFMLTAERHRAILRLLAKQGRVTVAEIAQRFEISAAMKTEIKHPEKLVSTGAYSAAIKSDGWVYVSGQGPLDLKTGQVCHSTIEEETRLTMTHIGKIT